MCAKIQRRYGCGICERNSAEIQEDMSVAYLKSVAAIQEDYYSGI
jgi:hypothetical protein